MGSGDGRWQRWSAGVRGGRSNSVGKPARASHSNSVDSSFVSASGPAAVGYEEAVHVCGHPAGLQSSSGVPRVPPSVSKGDLSAPTRMLFAIAFGQFYARRAFVMHLCRCSILGASLPAQTWGQLRGDEQGNPVPSTAFCGRSIRRRHACCSCSLRRFGITAR